MAEPAPDAQRAEMLARWERAAAGWCRRAEMMREHGMAVSTWMIDQLALQPGQRVLELAAGPGDTGFLAAELVRPGGTLISSDAAKAMLDVARQRAAVFGIDNVEFRRLELEWLDLPTASVDAILCRWGLMLALDPETALHEARRVLRPGGRVAVAVWDDPALNPWATIASRAVIGLGLAEPPQPGAPGMFALAAPGRLRELLESAGFTEVTVATVDLARAYRDVGEYIDAQLDLSQLFAQAVAGLSDERRRELDERIASLAEPYLRSDGSFMPPGRSLVAAAGA